MRALTVIPGQRDSLAVSEVAEPAADGELVVDAVAMGVCGPDREIAAGDYGWAPPGEDGRSSPNYASQLAASAATRRRSADRRH